MTTSVYEWRITAAPVELRSDDTSKVAVGHAAVFNEPTDIWGVREIVEPGAFTKTLKEADARGLFNHEPDNLLGRALAGTLRMNQDDTGLAYEIDLPDTTVGRDVAELLRRRDLNGSSFGFRVIRDEWIEHDDGTLERRIKEVSLRDVGPVTFPAYVATDAALRSLCEVRSVDLTLARSAAHEGRLSAFLSPEGGDRSSTTEDERRESTFVPHRSWMNA